MANINEYVKGTCMEMCPLAEIQMRENERLLHILEIVPGTEKNKIPKADKSRMVKVFSRSAAGKQTEKSENLRPPEVLLKTVSYLLTDVISNEKIPWYDIYDYINDRLFAVRQDMIVQNISEYESITILQPIVRFYAFSLYKLCEESFTNFDAKLNSNVLLKILNKLLRCFDCYNSFSEHKSFCSDYLLKSRPQFEALYLLFNIGNNEALRRALTIPTAYKNEELRKAMQISLCYKYGNYVRMCRLIAELPTLLAATAALHLPEIRRKTFQIMSTAYNNKNLSYPTCDLQNLLLYNGVEELLEDCQYFGIKADRQGVNFVKNFFDGLKMRRPYKHQSFVENKITEEGISSLLFNTC